MVADCSYTVRFSPLGDTVACRDGETVLAAIMRSGAKVMFGCRGGGCGTCKMRLISGRVDHGRCSAAVLPETEKTEGSFLSCQARPLTDLVVELTETNRYRKPSVPWLVAHPPEAVILSARGKRDDEDDDRAGVRVQ